MKYCKCGFKLEATETTTRCEKCGDYVAEYESEPLEKGATSTPPKEEQS